MIDDGERDIVVTSGCLFRSEKANVVAIWLAFAERPEPIVDLNEGPGKSRGKGKSRKQWDRR
jgi:hypothetical protein